MGKKLKYKLHYRKSSFKKDITNGEIFLYLINEHKPNSVEGVLHLLRKYKNNVELYAGYSHNILKRFDLSIVDFCFLDGGHTYETVKNDLAIILSKIKKKSIILIDDYNQSNYGVKKAVDEIKNNYYYELLDRFILIRNN